MRYQAVGITDERTACECCGKTGLRRTVVLRPEDGSQEVFYGTTCAALALTGRRLTKAKAEGYVAGLVSERANWAAYADSLAKHMATRGQPTREAALATYAHSNRGIAAVALWTDGTRWFGWTDAHPGFTDRLLALGWTTEACVGGIL